jgi:cell division protein ZapE
MVAALVPPPQFDGATFETYRADPPSLAAGGEGPAHRVQPRRSPAERGGLFRRAKKAPEMKPGVYLDGGFGVGKTHLLASIYHAMPARRKYFGSFIEYTALVGALGYQKTVELFRGADLLCIDEFELDDPGDTMVMTRLLGELVPTGTKLAATSNTPPNALGEGGSPRRTSSARSTRWRRASRRRIDGTDYRQRASTGTRSLDDGDVRARLEDAAARGTVSDDDFAGLIRHLAPCTRRATSAHRRHLHDRPAGRRPARGPVRGAALRRLRGPRVRRADPGARDGTPLDEVFATRCSAAATARSTCARSRASTR